MKFKKIFTLSVSLLIAGFSIASCGNENVPIEQILNIVEESKTLYVGGTFNIELETKNLSDEIIYISSDETIATVDSDGKVTAISVGEVIITVKSGDLSDSIKITVKERIQIDKFTLSLTEEYVQVGESLLLEYEIEPNEYSSEVYFEAIKGENLVEISGNRVKALSSGEVTIIARCANAMSNMVNFSIYDFTAVVTDHEIYKGDYLHGKRNKYPAYYEDVVEPIVSKEMWENCQVQQQKNSRSYQRYQTYLFLQKLNCPVCGRIMGGKATYKKKFDKTYYYYGCNECKNNIKEDYIEESVLELLGDIFEYDSVVNEFFLPMIKSKLSNPKEEIEKEIKNQQAKRERIKQAYINGSFTLEEHDKEVKYVDDTIAELERQILEQEQVKELKFTPEDILIKRDMDFINRVKLPMLYKAIV